VYLGVSRPGGGQRRFRENARDAGSSGDTNEVDWAWQRGVCERIGKVITQPKLL